MTFNPELHHRQSFRLKNYDYSQNGAYFITACTQDNIALFGEIKALVGAGSKPALVMGSKPALVTGSKPILYLDKPAILETTPQMELNQFGNIVCETWTDLINHNTNIYLDYFVVMPNHFHGIIFIENDFTVNRAGLEPAPTKTQPLSEIVRQFKTFSAKRINKIRNTPNTSVWQRNFFERVIRNENELTRIRQYIINNPLNSRGGF